MFDWGKGNYVCLSYQEGLRNWDSTNISKLFRVQSSQMSWIERETYANESNLMPQAKTNISHAFKVSD